MIGKIEAILAINENAEVSMDNEDYDTIQWGDTTVISLADIEAKVSEMEIAKANAITAKATAKVSGNTKLLALGLTQAEATALTGYTPE